MTTDKILRVLGQAAILTLAATLAACGGSSDAGSPSAATSASTQGASPSVSGTPDTSVAANNRYSFRPTLSTNATAEPVSFSIQNKPTWASFAVSTGELSGTPSAPDTGLYPNIVISASSGRAAAALPAFAIQVTAATLASSSSSSSSSSSGGPASSSSSSSSGGSASTAASLSAQAATLLNYLSGLSSDSRHILAGQHTSYWDANPMDNVSALTSQTGTKPAILGVSFGISGSTENGVALANQWIAAGGIADVMWVPPDPANGTNPSSNDAADFPAIYTPGNALNTTWNGYVDAIAAQAKSINGPFIFRLFPEENGGWFWYGNINPTQMIALWRYTHDRLIADGVTNALWMYNINAGVGNYAAYYPGAAYADLVSWDSYPVNTGDTPLYNALLATGKPILVAETGASPNASSIPPYSFDNATILATIKASFPKVIAAVVWCQNLALSQQQGDEAFMTDPAVITLADLPASL